MKLTYVDDYFFLDADRMPDAPAILEVGCFEPDKGLRLKARYPRGRVLIVEGSLRNYATLQRRLPPDSRIETAWLALAEQDAPLTFYDFEHEQFASAFPRHQMDGRTVTGQTEVHGRTLAGLMSRFGVERLDLLLLNCEGAEIFAMEQLAADAALRGRVTQFCTSTHCDHVRIYPRERWDAAFAALRNGYEARRGKFEPIPYWLFTSKAREGRPY